DEDVGAVAWPAVEFGGDAVKRVCVFGGLAHGPGTRSRYGGVKAVEQAVEGSFCFAEDRQRGHGALGVPVADGGPGGEGACQDDAVGWPRAQVKQPAVPVPAAVDVQLDA